MRRWLLALMIAFSPALVLRADAILPIETGDEVAAGIANDRRSKLLDEIKHVAPKSPVVRGRMISPIANHLQHRLSLGSQFLAAAALVFRIAGH